MKVEKINNNKAAIIITSSELSKMKITLKDIKEGADNVQDFFFDVLQDANLIDDFSSDSSHLFVEVATSCDDTFIITITKVECLPDISKYANLKTANKSSYTVNSDIYCFSSLNDLYEFCNKACEEELYVGTNSLYELNNKYYLLFSQFTVKKSAFVKTFSVISEYIYNYFSNQTTTFLEYATLIVEKNAIQTLQKI